MDGLVFLRAGEVCNGDTSAKPHRIPCIW